MSLAEFFSVYGIFFGNHPAVAIRIGLSAGASILCLTFSKVGGRAFLNQCLKDGLYEKIDFESFDNLWESMSLPDFHHEEESVLVGHASELLCSQLEVYLDLVENDYDMTEVCELYRQASHTSVLYPWEYFGCSEDKLPKDLSLMEVQFGKGSVKYYYDKSDALALVHQSDDARSKKRVRKEVLHCPLPYRSFEPVKTYTGLTGDLIAYLFWIDSEFG